VRMPIGACAVFFTQPAIARTVDLEAERRALLAIHDAFKAAHLGSDADAVLRRLAAD